MPNVTKKVILAFTYTDADDKTHKAGSTVTLPRHEANRLIKGGLARLPEDASPTSEQTRPPKVAEILDLVGENTTLAQAYLDAENATDQPRSSLVKKLTAIVETADPGSPGDTEEN